MFHRYTEKARRTIFFARYEASQLHSQVIESEHLLLGLFREDETLRSSLSLEIRESIRTQIEAGSNLAAPAVPTTDDLPLSNDAKRALSYSAEEAECMGHLLIDCGHLVLGLLRLDGKAAGMLELHGIKIDHQREVLMTNPQFPQQESAARGSIPEANRSNTSIEREARTALPRTLRPVVEQLTELTGYVVEHLKFNSEAFAIVRLKRKPWSRKEAMGHLVDWAVAHQHWISFALAEVKLVARQYPPDEWVSVQRYSEADWRDLVEAWISTNQILLHLISQVPEQKLNTPCRIGLDAAIPLWQLIEQYLEHCEDIVGQILSRL